MSILNSYVLTVVGDWCMGDCNFCSKKLNECTVKMDLSGTLRKTEDTMDYKDRDRDPRTRTETKKQGKKGGGPYSAKHVRMAAEVAEKRQAAGSKLKKSAEVGRGR